MVESKRKKFHDKDKYYRLAKEQGLRSRAAFKLSQINRKYPFLEKCQHGVLDICAAPGGWAQMSLKTCPKGIPIVAVDILPIRHIPGVKTLIGDITTAKCQAEIHKTVGKVDAVLHDGAPNVGAEYGKDAYEQNELVLHALKCATHHLLPGGTFCTKVYRSKDYASIQWVLNQLFGTIHTIKPAASRSQSAEIFFLCLQYKAPTKIDPRLFDPKHIFADDIAASTGGVMATSSSGLTVLDKNWDKKRRKRGGYDMEHLDATMRHIESVRDFVMLPAMKSAVDLLSQSTGLSFYCQTCKEDRNAVDKKGDKPTCPCEFLLHHPLTSADIKECVSDLQVLNQSDFKRLLSWRTQMRDALNARDEMNEADSDEESDKDEKSSDIDSEEEDEKVLQEIAELKARRQRERKRQKKKEKELAAKRRRRAAMDVLQIDEAEDDKIFTLATLTSQADLDATVDVNLDQLTDEQIFGNESDDDDGNDSGINADEDEEERRKALREKALDDAYNMYLRNTKNGEAKSGTRMAKRSKKLERQKVVEEALEDQEMALVGKSMSDYNTRTYAEMLTGPKDSDDSDSDASDDDGDDGFSDDPMTPEEHAILVQQRKSEKTKLSNPLIHSFAEDEKPSVKSARWFSNPLFTSIGKAAEEADTDSRRRGGRDEDDSDADESDADTAGSDKPKKKRKVGISADEVLAMIPKTDKQVRHEKRLKAMAREERKKDRRAKQLGKSEEEFELVPAGGQGTDEKDDVIGGMENMSEAQKKRLLEARALIKAGMGAQTGVHEKDGSSIEVVPGQPLPKVDLRNYGDEDYDSDDYAQTLALGTMMLRRSKEKAFVDASYNRYAWNDPEDLPDWFVDDENKHYRPQLPIPPALVAKMKERVLALTMKPIKKVAEARARKKKRARDKLAAAKKKAEAMAKSNSDMSEAMKLKAISKALRGQDSKKPGKSVVVAKKGRAGMQGAKGVKLVDKRMKADARGMKRAEKKKGGKRKR
ncbi:AdoMet-dependent rRNA methyltransferase SPB1 [Fistulifera solaris]|uniref:AdoMet-dependent rRNA methyltransferase SPB1 n=1 Tax=Fistulifera solaris TaxID=1519565 RepID=A0A1Z5JSY4_FISSO|nr:AdoMet-dependent rRNA methyltransferase SPB1 [Fistulifera solaris]|eukprot:GAX17049.1 AdoMet-dependent rRNA methyltransferase SPB1 [Fistulifera solaris]